MMPSGTNTPKLDLLRIQETWQFGDVAFNRFIDDADNKLVGVAHLQSPMHWTEWKPETEYAYGDVVRYPNLKSHQYAVCLSRLGGTSDVKENMPSNNVTGSIFMDNTVKWEVRSLTEADANGGTIRIWLGGGVSYARGDAVRYGDALYRAKIDHESSTTFAADENLWQEIYASIRFWKPNTYYYLDDTAIYDDIIYKCIEAHKSVANFESDSSATPPVVGDEDKWEIIGGAGGAKDWETNKKYQYGQLVLVNGILYRCNTKHKSNATAFQNDILKWDLVEAQIHDWVAGEYYVAGTLVAYNDVIYKCQSNHLASADFTSDLTKWKLYHETIIIWQTETSYYAGQIVIYTGINRDSRLYRCLIDHVSDNTTIFNDIAKWQPLNASIAAWQFNTVYKVGEFVTYGNELFRCIKDHTSNNNASSSTTKAIFDDITTDPNTNKWKRIRVRNSYVENWTANTIYDVNQLVSYNGCLYKCNEDHVSGTTFDASKWDLVYANIQPWTTGIIYKVGSIVWYNNRLYRCITQHTSTTFFADKDKWQLIYGYNIQHEVQGYDIQQGMNVKVTEDGLLVANDLVKLVRAAQTNDEITQMGSYALSNKEIFSNWTSYTCDSNGTNWNDMSSTDQALAKASYSFDATNDAIICNRNNDAFSMFLSQEEYTPNFTIDYTIDNSILASIDPTLPGDDDALFFICGFMQDIHGDYHTLSVIRVGDTELGHGMRFAIAYDVYTSWVSGIGSTGLILANDVTLIPHAWDSTSFANLQVQKNGTSIIASTSEINATALTTTLTYTLPSTVPSGMTQDQYDNIKFMIENPTRVGFGTQSNPSAFKMTSSLGSLDGVNVYDLQNKQKVYFEGGVQISTTPDTVVIKPQEFIYSEINNRLFFVQSNGSIKEIELNTLVPLWEADKFYVQNEIVKYQAGIYRCLQINKDSTWDTNKWEQIGGTIVTKQQIDNLFI